MLYNTFLSNFGVFINEQKLPNYRKKFVHVDAISDINEEQNFKLSRFVL